MGRGWVGGLLSEGGSDSAKNWLQPPPELAKIIHTWWNSAQNWPTRPKIDRTGARLGHIRNHPGIGHSRPKLEELATDWVNSAKVGPKLVQVASDTANAQMWATEPMLEVRRIA